MGAGVGWILMVHPHRFPKEMGSLCTESVRQGLNAHRGCLTMVACSMHLFSIDMSLNT